MFFRAVAFVVALMAGMFLSQVPEFAQQYRQRLGGAIDELAQIITRFDQDAARFGYDRERALQEYAHAQSEFIHSQGAFMRDRIARYTRLVAQQQAFTNAGPFGRIVVLFSDLDREIAENATRAFEPALPTTLEGVVFATGGFIVVFLFLHGLRLLFRRPPPSMRRAEVHHHHHHHHGTSPPQAPSD
jgi:hypothetical protein